MREKSSSAKIKIVAEHVNLPALDLKFLTNDVKAVLYEEDGKESVDLARGSMVDVFDTYHDLGYKVKRVWSVLGYRNPKLQECELRVKF